MLPGPFFFKAARFRPSAVASRRSLRGRRVAARVAGPMVDRAGRRKAAPTRPARRNHESPCQSGEERGIMKRG